MKDSKEFVRDWYSSHLPVFDVALFLRREGLNVHIPVPRLRPDEAERWKFVDDGDIACVKTIQVKHRQKIFDETGNYPHATILLDEVYKTPGKEHAREDPKAMVGFWGYVILNMDRTCVAIVSVSTRKHWVVETHYDEKQNRNSTSYACPRELARYSKL